MIEQRKRHFLIFLPVWIIPVFLITFGSLINFHQHRIWGKQLLPTSYITPRDKTKVVKIQDVKNHGADLLFCETGNNAVPHQLPCTVQYCIVESNTGLQNAPAFGTRGPPVA